MRLPSATRAIVLLFLALGVAALLDARGLRKDAEIQQPGWGRSVALAATRPLARVSDALYLDRPREGLQRAIGRADEDRIDTRVAFRLPPPAGPLPRPHPAAPAAVKERVVHKRHYTSAHPLRIWIAGDSLAEVPGQSLERVTTRVAAARVVGVESRLATGLGQPAVYNWFTRIERAVPELHPDVAVFSFGADDAHDFLGGMRPGQRVGNLGSPSWRAEYRRRVDGVTRELAAAGVYVVWLGLPIPAGRGFRHSFPVVNSLLQSVARAHPAQSSYIDTWHMLDSKRGGYADYLRDDRGRVVLMRARDGIHYTPAAGDMIARVVLRRLNRVFALDS
jgi:hypothetical protein